MSVFSDMGDAMASWARTIDLNTPEAAVLVAALLATLTAGVLVARRLRHLKLAALGTTPVVAIVLGTTIDGAIRFAVDVLGAQGIEILFPAIVFESLAIAVYAKAKAHADQYGDGPGRWAGRLYLVGVVAGLIVSSSATAPAGAAFRFAIPVFGAWLVVLGLTPDKADSEVSKTSWRWTPRRIGIALRLVVPGEQDAQEIDRSFQTRRIVTAAYRLHHSTGRLAGLRRTAREDRLRRLTLDADDEIVTDAERRIERASRIVETLDPGAIAERRRQRSATESATEAAFAEAERCRLLATDSATESARLADQVATLLAESASVADRIARAESATRQAIGNVASLADELDRVRAESANRQERVARLEAELRERRQRPAITRETSKLITVPFGDLPTVERVAPETVAAVAAAWTGNPGATQAEIADAAGVSLRTAGTVLRAIRRPAVNGGRVGD